jgi:hypothetical protein
MCNAYYSILDIEGVAYLGTEDVDTGEKIFESYRQLATAMGFIIKSEGPLEKGSLFKRFTLKLDGFFRREPVAEVVRKGKKAIELQQMSSSSRK